MDGVLVGETAVLVLPGVAVGGGVADARVGDTVGVGVAVAVGGKGIMLTGVSGTAVPVSRRFVSSTSDSAAMVGSSGANSKS